jgi:predicted tellurium resistance membrane protein TerC
MTTELLMSFLTLSLLEIVLGIDNLIFIALVADNLPQQHRNKARVLGLTLALVIRIAMLASISWIMQLTEPLFHVGDTGFSIRDLLLLGGGLFLIGKATFEMHTDIAGEEEKKELVAKGSLKGAIFQIVVIDFIFSFDSIITAVGVADDLRVMIAAVVVSMIVMLAASGFISKFLHDYPTFKMLALSFILMIGMVLVAEGMHFHVPKTYVYAAFTFSMFVELLNTIASKKRRKRMQERRQ